MPNARTWLIAVVLALLAASPKPGRAQAPACPVPAIRDTMTAGGSALPILTPSVDLSDFLARIPGSFLYDTGSPGWPDGWSFLGVDPARVGLHLEGVPYNDLVTGVPRYEMVPHDLLDSLLVGTLGPEAPVGAYMQFRQLEAANPYTELRYRSGEGGLQAVNVVHTQRRRLTLLGKQGIVQFLGSYGGRAHRGVYEGSRLRRERKIYGRFRFEREKWWFELSALRVRHEVGAHGGVEPRGPFDSIYEPFSAAIIHPNAFRLTNRSDIFFKLQAPLLPVFRSPLLLTAFRTAQGSTYNGGEDTLGVKARRYGALVSQPFFPGGPSVRSEAWMDFYSDDIRVPGFDGRTRYRAFAALSDSLTGGGWIIPVEAGVQNQSGHIGPVARLAIVRQLRSGSRFFTEAMLGGAEPAPIMSYGYGSVAGPGVETGQRFLHGRSGFEIASGAWDLLAFGFAGRQEQVQEFQASEASRDTIAAVAPFDRLVAGATADLGWRRQEPRGIYAAIGATWQRSTTAPTTRAVEESQPQVYGMGRLGARFVIFRGDLDVDAYLLGRFWTEFRSRTLHSPTGMLVLPSEDERVILTSGVLDGYIEARVRTATLFIGYENILSGTPVMPGLYQVPIYPLATQAIRFGLFWPIWD